MEADPDGTAEFCVGNADIYFLEPKPAYWDGSLQLLIHDETKKPFYSIVGAKRTNKGTKVDIVAMSIEDCLWDDPEMLVDYSEISETRKNDYLERDNFVRQKGVEINEELELEYFRDWVKKELVFNDDISKEEMDRVTSEAYTHFGLSSKDPHPEYTHELDEKFPGGICYPSYVRKRNYKWSREFEIHCEGNTFTISRR